MYGWFPRQPQNEQQNEQQNEPQTQSQNEPHNQLSDNIRNTNQQNNSQIETSELEMISPEDRGKWKFFKALYSGAIAKTFSQAVEFFKEQPCKYIVSIHGSDETHREYEMATLFKSYRDSQRKGIIKFLFKEYDDIKNIKYKVYADGDGETPIIIFYNIEDIKKLVEKMKKGDYNEPILKYIMKYYKYAKSEEEIKDHIDKYFKDITEDELLKLPFIWGPEINITDTIEVIVTKILFGTVTHRITLNYIVVGVLKEQTSQFILVKNSDNHYTQISYQKSTEYIGIHISQ